jgi:GTPase SAR1 family protein
MKADPIVQPTSSFDEHTVKISGMSLNVWDVSGKKSVRSLWSSYYGGSKEVSVDAIIWVVDSASSQEELEESKRELEVQMKHPVLQGKTLCILFNKCDEAGARKMAELKEFFNVAQYNKRNVLCFETSAKKGTNVKESMKQLAKSLKVEIKTPRDFGEGTNNNSNK